MNWLFRRAQEKSTIRGGALLSIVLGMYLGPAQADIVAQAVLALWGVVETVRAEKGAQ